MIIDFTYDEIFGFKGPNLCLLGNETDFENLTKGVLNLTNYLSNEKLDLKTLQDVVFNGNQIDVLFFANNQANCLGRIENNKVIFELDSRYWERLFIYFTMLSWEKGTYYLNSYEECLLDLNLNQEFNFICSSEF